MHMFSKHCQIVFQSNYINFYSHMRVPIIQSLANTWSFFFLLEKDQVLAILANIVASDCGFNLDFLDD